MEPARLALGRILQAALQPLGLELRPRPKALATFYRPEPSCQIPTLAGLYAQFLGERHEGTFVEVGAYDGVSFSNTSCLAAAGWSGLLIEPVPEFAARCRALYAGNPRIEVVESAVGDANGQLDLHRAGALSTANPSLYDEYGRLPWSRRHVGSTSIVSVTQQRLDQILEDRHIPVAFDLLVVDVEGFESQVFAGFDVPRWRPAMMIVELADTHPDLRSTRQSDAELSRSIREAGYDVVFKDMVNTVFVRTDVVEDAVS